MRRRAWIMLIVAALVALGVAITCSPRVHKWYRPPTLKLPENDDVVEMRASALEFEEFLPAIPEFSVPEERIPIILDWLRPAEYNPRPRTPRQEDEMGEVVLRLRNGEEYALRFYWTGKGPVMFTRDGVDQFYGREKDRGAWIDGGLRLRKAIQRASEACDRVEK